MFFNGRTAVKESVCEPLSPEIPKSTVFASCGKSANWLNAGKIKEIERSNANAILNTFLNFIWSLFIIVNLFFFISLYRVM